MKKVRQEKRKLERPNNEMKFKSQVWSQKRK